ncbi:MAG: acetyl-CoA carboxylase biotin carboxylase subunit [Pseudomonadota bacterium]
MTEKHRTISSILIANRGEIACRVIRTAKSMGIRTIAVYSEADAAAPHVQMADDVRLIGPAPVSESYLRIDRILEAAKETGADAIHPGYGFLSENADFARACAEAGVIFIGPPPDAIEVMGDKAKAKRRMIKAGVPCVPGYEGEDQADDTLLREAKTVGFPIMVKAAAGGGGRGMRLVEREADLAAAIATARSEAENAFGSGNLILERAIVRPRHIEIQVFADAHGHVVHLGERDCSVQRRHQKVLEEAPSPAVDPDLREKMGAAAAKAARDIDYEGAGTVEFLLGDDGAFYFLEMNTRLQVEHPVTEMITGLDLVEMQIRVARGEPLPVHQQTIALNGHAIEARLYAEDVSAVFLPAAGPIELWRAPAGARVDTGITSGGEASAHYDPMLAKIIAHGATREDARRQLIAALEKTALFGVATNRTFLINALRKQDFISGDATTAFISENFTDDELAAPALSEVEAAMAAVILHRLAQNAFVQKATGRVNQLLGWSSATPIATPYRFAVGEDSIAVAVTAESADACRVSLNGHELSVEIKEFHAPQAILQIDGARHRVFFHQPADEPERLFFSLGARDFDVVNLNAVMASAAASAGAGAVTAPMHGSLTEIFVKVGETVSKGQRVAVLEAMKMQHDLVAGVDGAVAAIHADIGAQIAAGAALIEIEETGA